MLFFIAHADVAQLVEHHLAKVRVASSNLVIRSKKHQVSGPTRAADLRFRLAGQRSFRKTCSIDCKSDHVGRTYVTGRDPDPANPRIQTGFASLPAIVSVLKGPRSLNIRGNAINKPLSKRIADSIEYEATAKLHEHAAPVEEVSLAITA